MRRTLGPSVAAGLALSLGLTGCATAPAHPKASHGEWARRYEGKPADFAAIRQLMHHRAQAVLHDDRAAFLATVDPADHRFVARERTLFDNLTALPVQSMSYTVEGVSIPRRPLGEGPQLSPPVVEYVALAGADVRPVSNPLVEVFVRRDHHWLLASDREHVFNGTTDVQSRPWGAGPVDVALHGDTVVVLDQGSPVSAQRLLDRVDGAFSVVGRVLGRRADRRLLVDATSTGLPDEFNPLSHEDAAATTYPVHESPPSGVGRDRYAGTVVKVNPHRLRAGLGQYGLLRHELTHVALRTLDDGAPVWLVEGVADYVGFQPYPESALVVTPRVRHRLDRMARHPALPDSREFDYDPAENYAVSHAAVLWLVQHYGMPKLIELLTDYHRAARRTGLLAPDGRMLERVYGISARELAAEAFAVTRRMHVA